jgi:hypothetical protein
MSEQLTPEQQEEGLRKAIEWRDTVCPKGLLDPLTNRLHSITTQKIGAYIDERGGDTSPAWLSKAVEALWEKLIWFGAMPPKPKRKPTEPKYEPPLQIHDRRRVEREFRENQQRERDEAQKAIDKALEAAKKTEEDKMPDAVYYESGPRSGQINHSATEAVRAQWRAKHPWSW